MSAIGLANVGIITQARMTSTRLPGKVLIEVGGKSLLDHHLDRLAASGLPVLVATTSNHTDDKIVEVASARGLAVFRGSEGDVLSRFHGCAEQHGLDVIVRVTSDCPLIDGELVAVGVQEFLDAADPHLYLSNTLTRSFPRGFDFEVFSAVALADAHDRATKLAHREHVTPYLYGPDSSMNLKPITWVEDKSSYRVTVDTAEDLALVRTLIENHDANARSCSEIIALLDDHPELVAINGHVEQKKLGE